MGFSTCVRYCARVCAQVAEAVACTIASSKSGKRYQSNWPNVPFSYLDFGQMAPMRVKPTGIEKDKEIEEDFALQLNWLSDLKVPAAKVTHHLKTDGEEVYTVHFPSPIVDIKDFREKKTLSYQAYGKHHALRFGYERAAAMAFIAFAATRMQSKPQFGCGPTQWNGLHGNETNEFYVYPIDWFAEQGNWNPAVHTFAPREAYCWNNIIVEEVEHDFPGQSQPSSSSTSQHGIPAVGGTPSKKHSYIKCK